MRRTISRFSSSLMGLLRPPESDTSRHEQVEWIRQAILDCMAAAAPEQPPHSPLHARVLHAQDIQALWYLRSDLMHWLSMRCGEAVAVDKLREITEMFQFHLPTAQFASSRRRANPSGAPMKKGP